MYFNTAALARQLERLWTTAFKPFDLTPPQAFMLRALLDRPAMLQSELADAMKIARPTATRALDGLAAKGLIERRSTERDGRECEIHPTAEAAKLKDALNSASAGVTRALREKLSEEAFDETVNLVKSAGEKLG